MIAIFGNHFPASFWEVIATSNLFPSLGREDPLEKGMATHSSVYAQSIPWTEEPGGLQSMGSQRVEHDWANLTPLAGLVTPSLANLLSWRGGWSIIVHWWGTAVFRHHPLAGLSGALPPETAWESCSIDWSKMHMSLYKSWKRKAEMILF